ncbi:putative cytochrome P450 4aa1 [Blattella germanica]|nr:putative cytochrome P450 4aa1 [Blattella germanica]
MFRAWLTVIPTVVLLEPEHIQIVLSSKINTEKIYFYSLLHNFLGKGLITSSGEKWKSHRKALQPSFHLSILEGFINTYHQSAQLMVKELLEKPDLSTKLVNWLKLESLAEAVLGIPHNGSSTSKAKSPFRQGKVVAPHRIMHPWLLLDWVYRHTDISRDEKQQQHNLFSFTTEDLASPTNQKALIDLMLELMEETDKFSETDAVHELCTFMLAGQDSVGASLAFCLFELASHPDIQEKVVQELLAVFGSDTRAPTMSDLRQLVYLEQCVKEALRLYPSVPLVLRTLTEDTKIGKHSIPAGCGVIITPYSTHHLPHIYPDPEKFDPDRFLPDQVEKRHPYAFIPFSAGPRNCIGHRFAMMELKTVISTLLRNFHLSTVSGREKLTLTYRITLRASGGIWLCLKHRKLAQS